MGYLEDLYKNIFPDVVQIDTDFDYNYTCNVFLFKNMTIIEIDRGWEGIPESLVINITLCLVNIKFQLNFN